jgi:hypothetical protein
MQSQPQNALLKENIIVCLPEHEISRPGVDKDFSKRTKPVEILLA